MMMHTRMWLCLVVLGIWFGRDSQCLAQSQLGLGSVNAVAVQAELKTVKLYGQAVWRASILIRAASLSTKPATS